MRPRSELNVLIAEHVFHMWLSADRLYADHAPLRAYSEDISAAMTVVEHFRRQWAAGDSTSNFWTFKDCGNQPWQAQIEFFPDHDAPIVEFQAEAETLPHAICLCALTALGISVPKEGGL